MNNVMLDLETMGKGPMAAIAAIGAVRFDSEVRDSFYRVVDLDSCVSVGMALDGDTVYWWLGRDKAAREALLEAAEPLARVLAEFAEWLGPDATVWGNGSDFDNVILASAYSCCSLKLPWRYSRNRCYRTVKSLCPSIKLERSGVHHNALDDARSQAEHLIRIFESAGRREATKVSVWIANEGEWDRETVTA